MEKALEILKEIRNTENEYDHLKKHRFDNAISELEEAMKPKSCEGCKFCGGMDKESFCVLKCMPAHLYEFEFCCNRYEPKENK